MNMTQQPGEWNIFKEATLAGSLHQWSESMSALAAKAGQQIGRVSKSIVALFSPRSHVSSMRVTWAGVLRSDRDLLVPEPSEEVRFQVANQMFLCEDGKRLVFDDTWNQEAWHDTTGYRIVFKTDPANTPKRTWHHWFTKFGRH